MNIKQRYLDIVASGIFAQMAPENLENLHLEVSQFLESHADSLDAADLFALYELHFYTSLLTNRDVQAKAYLDRFNDQFSGKHSQKLMVMRSMYYEAIGDEDSAVNELGGDPDELRASRRLATFSRRKKDGTKNIAEYIRSLNYYLDLQASDIVAWMELGDQYSSVGHYDKAAFCFKEVLLHEPTAYNAYYKAGLNLYLQHLQILEKSEKKEALGAALEALEGARDVFLRAVEISESYTKAWMGVYVVSQAALWQKSKKLQKQQLDEIAALGELARKRVMEIEDIGESEFEKMVLN